jgi:hypothetical protein
MAPTSKGGGAFPFAKEVEPGDGTLHLAMEENFGELAEFKLEFTQVAMQVRSLLCAFRAGCAVVLCTYWLCCSCACHAGVAHGDCVLCLF